MSSAPSSVLQALTQRIQEMEALAPARRQPPLSLGIAPLDELLPKGRLPAGSLVELLSAIEGAGTWTLALVMARHVCGVEKVLVIVDDQRCFYPPAAAQLGTNLDQSIVVRPRTRRDTFLAMNQSLRCSAVGAVVAGYDQLRTLDARRLQLAAEAGGGMGFLVRPRGALRSPSFATLRLLISPCPVEMPESAAGWHALSAAKGVVSPEHPTTPFACAQGVPPNRRLRVDVVRCRGGQSSRAMQLEVSDETGHVRVLPEMAAAATLPRAARAAE